MEVHQIRPKVLAMEVHQIRPKVLATEVNQIHQKALVWVVAILHLLVVQIKMSFVMHVVSHVGKEILVL